MRWQGPQDSRNGNGPKETGRVQLQISIDSTIHEHAENIFGLCGEPLQELGRTVETARGTVQLPYQFYLFAVLQASCNPVMPHTLILQQANVQRR